MANTASLPHSLLRGQRKYLNHSERQRFLAAVADVPTHQRLLLETLAWTGARVSEVLSISPLSLDLATSTVTLPTLKRRRPMLREIPLPPRLTHELDSTFTIESRQSDPAIAHQPLWPMSRITVWRLVKATMHAAGITGAKASPRGLRHAFGVGTLQSGVPLHLLQRWFGHARLSTTAIYADVTGPEEFAFAQRFWSSND